MFGNKKSLFAFIFCCLFLTSVSFYVWEWTKHKNQTLISWDMQGYYQYLPAYFYDDIKKMYNDRYIIDTYHPAGDWVNAYPLENGNKVIKYSGGMACMYLPGFAAGHFYAKLAGYPVDGFSYPYQLCMAMYSLLITFLGLWMARKILLYYFSDGIVAFTLIVLCVATNYLNYAAIVNMFSHNYLFTIYCFIIYLTIQWHKQPDYKKTIALGFLCGLAALTRPTEIICVLIPLAWGIKNLDEIKQRLQLLLQNYGKVILFGACAFAVGSLQLIYWKKVTGHYVHWSYGQEEGFDWFKIPLWSVLFSYRKGWFTYTPLMVLSIIGFINLYRTRKDLFLTVFGLSMLALYITFAWRTWWYGGSFSMRAVVQYYALLMFPLAAFFEWAFKRWLTIAGLSVFVVFCTWLNLLMTYQANVSWIMESDNMNGAYFWKIFGKMHAPQTNRKLLDSPEEIPEKYLTQLRDILQSDTMSIDNRKDTVFEGQSVLVLDEQHPFVEIRGDFSDKREGWLRTEAQIFMTGWETTPSKEAGFYLSLIDENSKEIKLNRYHLQRFCGPGRWEHISIDFKIPADKRYSRLKTGFYTGGSNKSVLINYMVVKHVPTQ